MTEQTPEKMWERACSRIAECQPPMVVTDRPQSRAGSLPQGICIIQLSARSIIRHFRRLARFCWFARLGAFRTFGRLWFGRGWGGLRGGGGFFFSHGHG